MRFDKRFGTGIGLRGLPFKTTAVNHAHLLQKEFGPFGNADRNKILVKHYQLVSRKIRMLQLSRYSTQ